jgi:hypothetical protein
MIFFLSSLYSECCGSAPISGCVAVRRQSNAIYHELALCNYQPLVGQLLLVRIAPTVITERMGNID